MQCFWGVESLFTRLSGVLKTRVGYAGGTTQSPTYYNIGEHTEITELQFDPVQSSYAEILDWFFAHHNPVQKHKKQYQSASSGLMYSRRAWRSKPCRRRSPPKMFQFMFKRCRCAAGFAPHPGGGLQRQIRGNAQLAVLLKQDGFKAKVYNGLQGY